MRLALLFVFGMLSLLLLQQSGPAGVDWAPVWAAGKLSLTDPLLVYDFDLVTALQPEPFGSLKDRPFIYPPTALLLFALFSLIPFAVSFALFATASFLWWAWLTARAKSDALLVAVSPPVVLAAMAGQPTLIVAALVLLACLNFKRPVVAGILLGIAVALKPTLLVLAPVALLAGRQWIAILAACLTAVLLALLSIAAFGLESWTLWLESIPKFRRLFAESPLLLRSAVTPYALGLRSGISAGWVIPVMAVIAIPTVWLAFSKERPAVERTAVLIGGSLLVSPYAMFYELAALAPFAVASKRPLDFLVAAVWGMSLFITASVAGLAAVFVRAASNLMQGTIRGPAG